MVADYQRTVSNTLVDSGDAGNRKIFSSKYSFSFSFTNYSIIRLQILSTTAKEEKPATEKRIHQNRITFFKKKKTTNKHQHPYYEA